jgi:hypothetical protein
VKSFAILRTNVGLTTNIKIMVDSSYNLSLSSIESNDELANTKFKKVSFIKNNYYDELINYFYHGLPVDTAFYIKYDNDVDSMSDDYSFQYDELYQCGARNIVNNKDYTEEFEYFAPLYISPKKLPKSFIIFRVDGPGIEIIDKVNFKSRIINKLKTVKIFDLTKNTSLGEWLDINFNDNPFFPLTPFEMSFENLEFTKWNGIDYESGGYTSKSRFLESVYEEEKEIFEFEKLIFDGYKNNKLVFSNILNMSFLFDDTPANSDSLRKWSINRYFGFYLDDMVKVKTISPYITPFIKSDAVVQTGNLLYSPSGDPFVEGFMDHKVYYVEYNGEYYKVEKYTETSSPNLQSVQIGNVVTQEYTSQILTNYKIISDIDLTGKQSLLNKNTGLIGDETTYPNRLLNYDNTNYLISDWTSADVWLIEVDGMYHNLVREIGPEIVNGTQLITTRIIINSDYSFSIGENDYKYFINKNDPSYTKVVSFVVDKDNPPKKFTIYKLKFTDIKDFDDKIIDTEYSKYEYENKYTLTETDETKIYLTNLLSKTIPKSYDDFIYGGEVINIPVSSEYTANYETFKLDKKNLSEIWRKNAVYTRWAFQNSLSANDVPYMLNNSLLFEDYNRTTNPFDPNPQRIERNLDYFYTINSSTSSYIHHTLHVEKQNSSGIDNTFKFELDKYLNLGTYSTGTSSAIYNFDYFSYFFERVANFDDYKISKNVKKYSLFNSGDKSIPNISLFRGLKFLIYDVEDIRKDENGEINILNLKTSNYFDGYKFSILLSDNDWSVIDSVDGNNIGTLTQSQNLMSWTIFDDWKMDKKYKLNDIVLKDEIIYISTLVGDNITTNPVKEYTLAKKPMSAPYNQIGWSLYTLPSSPPFSKSIFWRPTGVYPGSGVGSNSDIIYNNADYYYLYSTSSTASDFWNPMISDSTGYLINDIVLFKDEYYMSMISSNHYRPDYTAPYAINKKYNPYLSELDGYSVYENIGSYYWSKIETATQSVSPKWKTINIWNPSIQYNSTTYVVHDDVVYSCISSQTGNEPGVSNDWTREYSLLPDTTISYSPDNNTIIEMNNAYYMINSNASNSTLENGINIYINKKWKNILININISDNTIPNLSGVDRDILYNDLNSKLTAYNFTQCLSDLSNKYSFSDYLNYIIIEEDNSIKRYNYDSIEGLPYYITCETPDEVTMKHNSLLYKSVDVPKKLKPTMVLKSIKDDLSNLNYYNNVAIASEISDNKKVFKPIANFHGNKNITEETIYRFSGFYMPLFYDIQLFELNLFRASIIPASGNYKFDTTLSDFGLVKERKIRKINNKGSVLKLYNTKEEKSIYPMLQEFGYTTVDTFIFKSSWDINYHYITSVKSSSINPVANNEENLTIVNPISIGVQNPIKNINL